MSDSSGLIWNDCTGFSATPVLPNNTDSTRVCGLMTSNTSLTESCCGGSDVQIYSCWQYCATDRSLPDLSDCLKRSTGGNSTRLYPGLFCQGNSTGTTRQADTSDSDNSDSDNSDDDNSDDDTSAAVPRVRIQGLTPMLLVALLVAFLIGPTSADIVHSLGSESRLSRRQSDSSCKFTDFDTSAELGRQLKASAGFSGFASVGTPVDSGIQNNNRTINDTSAAEATYDAFFDALSDQFGRRFPAMSSVSVFYEFGCAGSCYASWVPWRWCVNGTVSGCSEELGEDKSEASMTACGPVFLSDVGGPNPMASGNVSPENVDSDTIQGILSTVLTA